ncbi:hypothetical protein NBE98_12190 [Clostridium swellfunianum]|uniref:hypothetical protein n=1 Tax=Clostridium swellfunianum TaxID=1367462 RepID=UPI00202EAD10|nr:hypothetical protein [Clostridium swellfunianum]MCM0649135.1 hypothetical protein [Clostridium swellfunianum]
MNSEDKEIFDLMVSLSEEESRRLLEDVDFGEEELSCDQRNRIKNNVLRELEKTPAKTRRELKKSLIAASALALIIFTGFTPPGKKAVAEIIKRLYFIPGVGSVQESKGRELYVLSKPIRASFNGGEIVVKSVVKDRSSLSLELEGDKYIEAEAFASIFITAENGNSYNKQTYSLGSGGSIWTGNLGFSNVPEDMRSFYIILPDKSSIHVALRLGESFGNYSEMGPTDIKNNLGITLVPSKQEDKMKFNLIEHPSANRKIAEYGQQVDLDNYGKYDISLKDDLGRQYELDYPKQFSSPLSEFYFVPKEDAKNYIVEIPEVSLTYKIDKSIKFQIPKEGELELNKYYDISGYTFTIKKAVRTGNNIRIYVDTNYDNAKVENLSELKIIAINSERSMGYSWNVKRDNRTVEYYEFDFKGNSKNIDLRISEFKTILNGPWKFQFPAK